MRTARTYLPANHELHSLQWTPETGKECSLNQAITSDLGPIVIPLQRSLNLIREERECQSSQCLRAAWIETVSCPSVCIASSK
jgi:hypothetical protein